MKTQPFYKLILGISFFFSTCNVFSQLTLNDQAQAILSNQSTGLVSTTLNNFSYTYADQNTTAIDSALSELTPGQDLQLPDGIYDVTNIQIPSSLTGLTIAGTGINTTTLRRKAITWDNNSQGDCPLKYEIFSVQYIQSFEIRNMTLDGNSHQMAICGYGQFDTSTGQIISGTPQFPVLASAGGVVNVSLSNDITFDNVNFKDGYGWCMFIGKVDGFQMRNCIIDTGNLSTEFKGHRNPAPNDVVMHAHTSQDGLHMVNVSNAVIEYNDIHSEDSGIAIEFNPLWDWGGYDKSENIVIRNNFVSTASPTDPAKLMNDDDIIYGTGLANEWVGQSAVDIFYTVSNATYIGGANGPFKNIQINQNSFEGVRQGVRCGFFLGAPNNAENINHRVYNLQIKDNQPPYLAGKDRNKLAGIRNVTKNEIPTSWNLNGGAGIAIRHTDSVFVSNNLIQDVKGGLGVSMQGVTEFQILNNQIFNISGTQLATNWVGGEGIRVYNEPSTSQFDALNFLIKDNYIGSVETTKIAIINTKNGISRLNENYNLSGMNICKLADGINSENTSNIDWGDCLPLNNNTIVSSILTSDNFESQTYWERCTNLNNQLGGNANYSWFYWDGQLVWPGYSDIGGDKSMGVVWSGVVPLSGFTINPDSIYQIESLVHPTGGNDGAWNNYSGLHLYAINNTDIWQSAGVRVRLSNGTTGNGYGNPNRLIVDLWEGSTGAYRNIEVHDFSNNPNLYKIDGTSGTDFWIPLKLIFKGAGTNVNPLKIDYYLNNTFLGSTSFNNLTSLGNSMIGCFRYGASDDHGAFDNFKITKLESTLAAKAGSVTTDAIEVLDKKNEPFSIFYNKNNHTLEINSTINSRATYQIYNIAGVKLYSGNIIGGKTILSVDKLNTGIFIVNIIDSLTPMTKSFKILVQ